MDAAQVTQQEQSGLHDAVVAIGARGWNHAGAEMRGFRGFSKLKRAIDAASGISEWWLHDIRRTVRTGMTKLGIPRAHAEAAINHVGGRAGLVGTYENYDYAGEIIAALTCWQQHVTALVIDNPPSAGVIPLHAA
jgi:hypothetical protein